MMAKPCMWSSPIFLWCHNVHSFQEQPNEGTKNECRINGSLPKALASTMALVFGRTCTKARRCRDANREGRGQHGCRSARLLTTRWKLHGHAVRTCSKVTVRLAKCCRTKSVFNTSSTIALIRQRNVKSKQAINNTPTKCIITLS